MVYPMTMPSAGPLLIQEFPEVVNAARLEYPRRGSVKYKDKVFQETGVCHGDNSVFEVFSFPFVAGNPETALIKPYTVVITESIAQKYFKTENPIGKILEINGTDKYKITGVIKDIPEQVAHTIKPSFTAVEIRSSVSWLFISSMHGLPAYWVEDMIMTQSYSVTFAMSWINKSTVKGGHPKIDAYAGQGWTTCVTDAVAISQPSCSYIS